MKRKFGRTSLGRTNEEKFASNFASKKMLSDVVRTRKEEQSIEDEVEVELETIDEDETVQEIISKTAIKKKPEKIRFLKSNEFGFIIATFALGALFFLMKVKNVTFSESGLRKGRNVKIILNFILESFSVFGIICVTFVIAGLFFLKFKKRNSKLD